MKLSQYSLKQLISWNISFQGSSEKPYTELRILVLLKQAASLELFWEFKHKSTQVMNYILGTLPSIEKQLNSGVLKHLI